MAYVALWNIKRETGKEDIKIGEKIPADIKGPELERLIKAKAVHDPEAAAKEIEKAKAEKAKAEKAKQEATE